MKLNTIVNVPPDSSVISRYRATLGHKANHSFRRNAKYALYSAHPVLGCVMGIRAVRTIPAGAEVLCDYQYSPDVFQALGLQLADKQCLKVISLTIVKFDLISILSRASVRILVKYMMIME